MFNLNIGTTKETVIKEAIDTFLRGLNAPRITYDYILSDKSTTLVEECMAAEDRAIDVYNCFYHDRKLKKSTKPSVQIVTYILAACEDIAMVRFDANADPNLAFRVRDQRSPFDSVWCLVETQKHEQAFYKMVVSLHPETDMKFIKEVKARLTIELTNSKKVKTSLIDGIHVPCRNGVFDRMSKTFLPWYDNSFDTVYRDYAFTYKLKVNYNPNATNPVITRDKNGVVHPAWDFNSHLRSLFDDQPPKLCALYQKAIWEIAAHVISGFSQGFGFFWCNSSGLSKGASGKSTLLVALRAIIGETEVCSNNINSLTAEPYAISQIIGKVAILSDEQIDGSKFIDTYDKIKTLITNEPISVREIYKAPIFLSPKLPFVQCTNSPVGFKGATESLYRRIRVVSFEKTFATDKCEQQYIKNDYIKREEVLEYIVRRCLEDVAIEYSPDVLEATSSKASIMKISFPVMQFMDELTDTYPIIVDMDVIPTPLLYDMFSNWYEITNHTKTTLSATNFRKQLIAWVDTNSDSWEFVEHTQKITNDMKFDLIDDVFADFPANVPNRKWTVSVLGSDKISFKPSIKIFRHGIRFIGIPPRDTRRYLHTVVLKDTTGEWHKEHLEYRQLYIDNNICKAPLSFEDWAIKGCPNTYVKEDHRIERREKDGDIPLVSSPIWLKN